MREVIKRQTDIDIWKGIGIIFVVLGHCHFPYSRLLGYFPYWHAAIFLLRGVTYQEKYTDSVQMLFEKRKRLIKRLYIPWFLVGTFFICMNNVFLKQNILTDNPELLNTEYGQYGLDRYMSLKEIFNYWLTRIVTLKSVPKLTGASWFVVTLLMVEIMYLCLDFILKRIRHEELLKYICMIAFVIAILYAINQKNNNSSWELNVVGYSLFFYHLGRRIRNIGIQSLDPLIMLFLWYALIYILENGVGGTFSYVRRYFANGYFFLLISICGWIYIWA